MLNFHRTDSAFIGCGKVVENIQSVVNATFSRRQTADQDI